MLPSVVVAVIVAVPAETAVTTPLLFTVATDVLLDFHVTVLLVVLLGYIVATNCSVAPTQMVVLDLFNQMDVANCFTITVHEALRLLPSVVVAVIVAVPAETAVTTPLLFTVATDVLLDFHVTVLLVALLGYTVATSCSVSPT